MNEITFTSDKSEYIIMIGDFNLSSVDCLNGLVLSPVNSISQHFRIRNEYFDIFTKNIWCTIAQSAGAVEYTDCFSAKG